MTGWTSRAFGEQAIDVALRFDADRAAVTSAVLCACLSDGRGQALPAGDAWRWTLDARLRALVAVRLAGGDATLELRADCGACGEAMELPLDLRMLAGPPAAPRFTWRDEDGVDYQLRLPRGDDLSSWPDRVASAEQIAVTLIEAVDGQPLADGATCPAPLLAALDTIYEERDPLTALKLHAECPHCGRPNDVACDLEAALLAGFARQQRGLMDEVVRLASAFHWSEADILSLPAWRRAHYLRRLDQAEGWA